MEKRVKRTLESSKSRFLRYNSGKRISWICSAASFIKLHQQLRTWACFGKFQQMKNAKFSRKAILIKKKLKLKFHRIKAHFANILPRGSWNQNLWENCLWVVQRLYFCFKIWNELMRVRIRRKSQTLNIWTAY